jgi:hypothetical protein
MSQQATGQRRDISRKFTLSLNSVRLIPKKPTAGAAVPNAVKGIPALMKKTL